MSDTTTSTLEPSVDGEYDESAELATEADLSTDAEDSGDQITSGTPAFTILGEATAEQVAALSVVLAAIAGEEAEEERRRSGWSDPGNVHGFHVRRRRPAWRSWRNR